MIFVDANIVNNILPINIFKKCWG